MLTLLLRRGSGCVDQRDAMGATPLAVAAEHGQLHAAEILLLCGLSALYINLEPLLISVFLGITTLLGRPAHTEALSPTLPPNSGSRVNAQTCSGESVLMGGAGSGSSALVRLLLEHGAQPDLASSTGHLPVHRAAARGHLR